MEEIDTVKSQLDLAISLFEDFAETLSRCEDHIQKLETSLTGMATNPQGAHDANFLQAMVSDANDLRSILIGLKQQMEKSVTSDLEPMTLTLKYLHTQGIPDLTDLVRDLNIGITALQGSMPTLKDSVNNVIANLAPIRADTAAAGKFARHFQDPMRELLGRTPEGSYDEGKFILRSMARIIFSLSGRDEQGKVEKGSNDRLAAFLDHYFAKHHLKSDGTKKDSWNQFIESFWDYCTSAIWHRVFDVVIAIIIYLLILNPASQAIKDAQAAGRDQLQKYALEMEKQRAQENIQIRQKR